MTFIWCLIFQHNQKNIKIINIVKELQNSSRNQGLFDFCFHRLKCPERAKNSMRSLAILLSVCAAFGMANGKSKTCFKTEPNQSNFRSNLVAGCENPKVQASSYTSTDAQVLTHIPFIAEFTLACSNGASEIPLYASIKGALCKSKSIQDPDPVLSFEF